MADSDWDVEGTALSSDGRTLVWTVNVDGVSQLRGRDLVTGADLRMPALPAGQATALSIAGDGRTVVVLLSTSRTPWNIAAVDLDSGRFEWLTDAKPTAADPAGFVDPTAVRIPSRDGHTIPAYLYLPGQQDGPLGVVVVVHGGPVYQERPTYAYDGFYQFLLAHGVAVLAPNIRGSSGYGQSYIESLYRDWGGGDLRDLADVVAYLHGQSWLDRDRIGLYGASYGGFAVLSCVSRLPEVNWAAAVDQCGMSNLATLAAASPPTLRSVVATVIGDPDDTDFLLSRSPITYADAIRAPIFIIQGANDPRVPPYESEQMATRLQARRVEVRYDVYPDEGHVFAKVENQIKSRSDAARFLIQRLAQPADPAHASDGAPAVEGSRSASG